MKLRKVDVTDNVLFLELLCFPFSRVFQAPLGENLKSVFTFRDSLHGKEVGGVKVCRDHFVADWVSCV